MCLFFDTIQQMTENTAVKATVMDMVTPANYITTITLLTFKKALHLFTPLLKVE